MARDDRWTWLVIGALAAALGFVLLLLLDTRAELREREAEIKELTNLMHAYHYAEARQAAEPEEE